MCVCERERESELGKEGKRERDERERGKEERDEREEGRGGGEERERERELKSTKGNCNNMPMSRYADNFLSFQRRKKARSSFSSAGV